MRRRVRGVLQRYRAALVGCWRHENNFTIKFHSLIHMASLARFRNPKFCWCYAFENCVGMIQTVAMSTTAGTVDRLTPGKVMENYLRVLSYHISHGL